MKQILFTRVNTAELVEIPEILPNEHQVMVQTAFSTVSCGTERANITGDLNIDPQKLSANASAVFPRALGYSSAGTVVKVGSAVTSLAPGNHVAVFWGQHKAYNTVDEANAVKITDERVSLREAALFHIGTFPLAALRKTQLEIGESMLVMGLGVLGQIAVSLARAAGAAPVIAADPVAERRESALALGADYALDPLAPDFADEVKRITDGGVNTAIEVTGVGAGFDETLDCMARFGRVALLGCTRDPNFTIDYYRKIHGPGITVVGAHTNARPETESHHGWYTHRDDIKALMRLCAGGRLNLERMICETHAPQECPEVYTRLIHDRHFPTVVQFDWSKV